ERVGGRKEGTAPKDEKAERKDRPERPDEDAGDLLWADARFVPVGHGVRRSRATPTETSRTPFAAGGARLDKRRCGKIIARVDIAAIVLIVVSVALTAVVVVGMFIWAAVKDGEEDKAVQAR